MPPNEIWLDRISALNAAALGASGPGIGAVQDYLVQFGYLDKSTFRPGVLDEASSTALAAFQQRSRVPVSGVFDQGTKEAMLQPRCGMRDPLLPIDHIAYVIGCKWPDRVELTYAFDNTQSSQTRFDDQRDAIRRAFQTWQAVIALDFREVRLSDSPDIEIGWRNGDTDLSMTPTPAGNVIAHADYPPPCSVVTGGRLPLPLHLDSSDRWTIGAAAGAFDIETVALHEVGHLIGLDHTTVMGAVMWRNINPNTVLQSLTQDDIDGAQSLYGRRLDFPRTTTVTVLSRNPDQLDIFAVNRDGGVYSSWWNGNPWRPWFRLFSNNFADLTPVSSLSRNSNQMDVFAVGPNGIVYNAWWNGNPWRPWASIGTRLFRERTPVATLSRNSNQMDLFAVDQNGGVWSAWWNGTWSNWIRIGSRDFDELTPIATLSRNSNQMDIFLVDKGGGGVWSAWWRGTWRDFFRIGTRNFSPRTPLASLSRNPNHMEVFGVGEDGGMYAAWWNGNWSDWVRIGTETFEQGSPVSAVSRNPNQMDIFAVASDRYVKVAWWNGNWNGWSRIGTRQFPESTAIAAICRDANHMDLFAVGEDGWIYSAWWDGQWHDWFRV